MTYLFLRRRRARADAAKAALATTYDSRFGAPDISAPVIGGIMDTSYTSMSQTSTKPRFETSAPSHEARARQDTATRGPASLRTEAEILRFQKQLEEETSTPIPAYHLPRRQVPSPGLDRDVPTHQAYIKPLHIIKHSKSAGLLTPPRTAELSPHLSPYATIRHSPNSPEPGQFSSSATMSRDCSSCRRPNPSSPGTGKIQKQTISRPISPASSSLFPDYVPFSNATTRTESVSGYSQSSSTFSHNARPSTAMTSYTTSSVSSNHSKRLAPPLRSETTIQSSSSRLAVSQPDIRTNSLRATMSSTSPHTQPSYYKPPPPPKDTPPLAQRSWSASRNPSNSTRDANARYYVPSSKSHGVGMEAGRQRSESKNAQAQPRNGLREPYIRVDDDHDDADGNSQGDMRLALERWQKVGSHGGFEAVLSPISLF